MSESIEMYLVMTALERKGNQPVQLSVLADKLSISAVSANEMCHKLAERGLIDYQPYKGVTLTEEGEKMAQRVLGRRRVWEMFLERILDIDSDEARTIACQLEHITSDKLIHALSTLLEQPSHLFLAAQGNIQSLVHLSVGQRGEIITLPADVTTQSFLNAQGMYLGKIVEVLAVGNDGSCLLDVAGQRISVAYAIATRIHVSLNSE